MIKVSLIIAIFTLVISCRHEITEDFDSKKWQANKEIRFQMIDDLIDKSLLDNKSPDDLIKLLGQPDFRHDNISRWTYAAGSAPSGFGIMFYTLFIYFKNGKVSSADFNKYQD